MAAILDVNVFVSAALSSNVPSAALLRARRNGDLDVVASPTLLAELDEVTSPSTAPIPPPPCSAATSTLSSNPRPHPRDHQHELQSPHG